jgi:hypothetical protein
MIFGQIRGKPWYGTQAGLVQGLTTGPHHIQLTGRHLLSVPGPRAAQRHPCATLAWGDTPERACHRHAQTPRVRPQETWPLAPLLVAEPIDGARITACHVPSPAGAIRVEDVLGAHGTLGGDKGFKGWGWGSLARPFG